MNIKAFLVDLDGVVLHRAGYFSARSKELYPSANHEAILSFFSDGTYKDVVLGKRDLVEALTEVLPLWDVGKDIDAVLKDWFDGENTIDHKVLDRIQEIRQSGIKCVLATDHSKYRKEQVWGELRMKDFFDGVIASADVGATKHDPDFYVNSLSQLNLQPHEVAFTDDDPKNVEVALSLGLQAVVFETIDSFNQIS